jgi:hypothetical protein
MKVNYYLDRAVKGTCEKCGNTSKIWSVVDESENPNTRHTFCGNCISRMPILERDLRGQQFVEDWSDEEGVIILCLYCGWESYIEASGDKVAVKDSVAREEDYHVYHDNCNFYAP